MHTLPDLPYAYDALEPYIDAQTMEIHHDRHHGTYVNNLNDALAGHEDLLSLSPEDLLRDISRVPEDIRTKVRNNGGGHYNHSLFWQIMRPPQHPTGENIPEKGPLADALQEAFGGFEEFKEKFSTAGLARFGSGWVWLLRENGKVGIVDTPNQDAPVMEGKTPVLGLDLWEHAYYLRYQNKRADYIKNWWQVVNWPEVARRFSAGA